MAKSTSPSALPPPVDGLHPHEFLPKVGGHYEAPSTDANVDRLVQRRKQVSEPGLPRPVTQIQAVAASDEQGVSLLDQRDPMLWGAP